MDRPDTLIELHRAIVEELTFAELATKTYPDEPVGEPPLYEGAARVTAGPSRVWFYEDANGRLWQEAPDTPAADRERHFAIDLRLADHGDANLPNSRVLVTKLLGLPAPTSPPTTCRGESIPANEIPLPGRLIIHERLERIASTVEGTPGQNIVLDFRPQPAPVLVCGQPRPGVDARLYGPGLSAVAGGGYRLEGQDPRIVWELTQEERQCVTQSTVGRVLAVQMGGEDAFLTRIARQLAQGVAKALLTAGENGTPVKSVLPNPAHKAADQVGIPVGPECATGTKAIEIDARVKRWNRPDSGDAAESLVFQLRTVDEIPDGSILPASVLALREREMVGFSRAGWALLRSIRCSQMKSLCLDEDDFQPDVGCTLKKPADIVVGDNDAKLERFAAEIVPSPDDEDIGLLRIGGRAEGGSTLYDWWMEFEIDFRLDRGEAPRDRFEGEPGEREMTLDEIAVAIDELYAERCSSGGRSREDIDADIERLIDSKKLPPQTIGVKPIDVRTWQNGDAEPTALGYVLGFLAVAAITVVTGGAAFGFTAGVVFTFFVLGVAAGAAGVGAVDAWVLDAKLREQLSAFVTDNRDPAGEPGPLPRYQAIHVELAKRAPDVYDLNAFFEEMPSRLMARWRTPDVRKPAGDPDYVIQWLAGLMPEDDRVWMLTVGDGAHYIDKGWLTLTVPDPGSPTGEAEVHAATSSKGRRYLRTDPDGRPENDLKRLPPLPEQV